MAKILTIDGQSPEFFFHLALEQMEAGAYYEGLLNLIKARELDENPQYALQLAEAYYNTKNFAQSTNIYIGLFFGERRMAYILAIYRNLLQLGRTRDARRFVLNCLRDPDNISTDDLDILPEMDEEDLQRVLGLVENNDIESFFDLKEAREAVAGDVLDEYRELITKGNYDEVIMRAMEIESESPLYNGAQEIICIAASEREDYELAETTARAQAERMPDSLVAFSVLALMPDRVPQKEIAERMGKLAALVGSDPVKAVSLLRALAQTKYNALFEKYLEEFYALNNCSASVIAYKMAVCYARGKNTEGAACLRRLQMLFPDDFMTRAYCGLVEAKIPKHSWQQMLHIPFCTDVEAVKTKFLSDATKQKNTRVEGEKMINALCTMIAGADGGDISYLIGKSLSIYTQHKGILNFFFLRALSDLHIDGEQKCDLAYGMLMYGWDSQADIMMGDTFVHCRIASLAVDSLPALLAKLYCEIYVQMISDGEEPDPDALFGIVKKMGDKGVKRSMRFDALLAVTHYLYELSLGSEDEELDDYTEVYEANPKTVEKYLKEYKDIIAE